MDPAPRAGLGIERMAPARAVGCRVACRRIGSEVYTVHWFPTARQRPSSLFKLNPVELPLEIPCSAEYVVVYTSTQVEDPSPRRTSGCFCVAV